MPQAGQGAGRLAVIAAGGTGGHMFPAQALAEALLARGWQVVLSTDARGARYTTGFPRAVEIEEVESATFARGGLGARLAVPGRLAVGIVEAMRAMRRRRPAIVVGFGGYPSVPALAAATLLKLPRLIHEQNGVPGAVNAFFATRVDAVACGTWPTTLKKGAQAVPVGNPVRAAIAARAGAPYAPPGETGPVALLVFGGSQGARIMAEIVPSALGLLPAPLRARLAVAQQAREEDMTRVTTFYRHAGIAAEVSPFFSDMPERMTAAQLVVSRAGASSIAELAAIGRPSILIPYAAAAGDHQTANARPLDEAGGAIVLPEAGLTPEKLAEAIAAVLQHPDRAVRMADGAKAAGRPDATERLVELVEKHATREAGT